MTSSTVVASAPPDRAGGPDDRPARAGRLVRRYLAGWAASCQLVLDLLLAGPYLALIAVGVSGVGLALAGGIGLLLIAVVVPTALAVGILERARLEAFTGIVVPPPTPPERGASLVRRLYLGARPWKALLHVLLIGLWGLVAGTVVVAGAAVGLATTLLPLYRSRLPGDRLALPVGQEVAGDALGWVALSGLVLLVVVVPLLSLLLVRVDVALVRGLLGAGSDEQVSRLSQRVATLTETRERTVDSVELERRRIERDLHDGPQQRLVAIAMDLGMARERLGRDPDGARELLDKAHASAKEAITEMRQVARGIHPPVLTDRGLDAALSALAARSQIPVSVAIRLPGRPSSTTEAIAYFCVSEALTNVAKHSRASRAHVTVHAEDAGAGQHRPPGAGGHEAPTLVVTVEDNGAGGARLGAGSGLVGLRDRVAAVDGALHVDSPEGGPTRLTVRLPWQPGRPDPLRTDSQRTDPQRTDPQRTDDPHADPYRPPPRPTRSSTPTAPTAPTTRQEPPR